MLLGEKASLKAPFKQSSGELSIMVSVLGLEVDNFQQYMTTNEDYISLSSKLLLSKDLCGNQASVLFMA